jgi:hypothetical protein
MHARYRTMPRALLTRGFKRYMHGWTSHAPTDAPHAGTYVAIMRAAPDVHTVYGAMLDMHSFVSWLQFVAYFTIRACRLMPRTY